MLRLRELHTRPADRVRPHPRRAARPRRLRRTASERLTARYTCATAAPRGRSGRRRRPRVAASTAARRSASRSERREHARIPSVSARRTHISPGTCAPRSSGETPCRAQTTAHRPPCIRRHARARGGGGTGRRRGARLRKPVELLTGACAPQTGQAYYALPNDAGGQPFTPRVGDLFRVGVGGRVSAVLQLCRRLLERGSHSPARTRARGRHDGRHGAARLLPPVYEDAERRAGAGVRQPHHRELSDGARDQRHAHDELERGHGRADGAPKTGASFPDSYSSGGGGYWFIGQASNAGVLEAALYTKVFVEIPVKATAPVNGTMGVLLCTVGTTCTLAAATDRARRSR